MEGLIPGLSPDVAKLGPAPLLVGWDDRFDCGYAKAQHCLRLGRVGVFLAKDLAEAPPKGAEASPHDAALRLGGATRRRQAVQDEAFRARKFLLSAVRLYDKEIDQLGKLSSAPSLSDVDLELWGLGLCCARMGATALLVEASRILGRSGEAEAALEEAVRESAALQRARLATPRLRRLLAVEHARLQAELSAK